MIEPKEVLKKVYRMPESDEIRAGKIMRLDHNERTIPLSQEVFETVWKQITPSEVVAYPVLGPLYKKLAQFLGVARDHILLCSGSDAGIKNIFEVYVEKSDEVVMLVPSFGMFSVYCDMFGAVQVPVEYDQDFHLPVERITGKINKNTKLVILANPNHTGTVMAEKDICAVVEHAAKYNAIVLADEAYHHFYKGTMIAHIDRYDNLMIVRTFSKAFGIAPLRVGYLISQPHNIQNLRKVKLTFEITSVSAKFAEYLIDHPEICEAYVKDVREGKDYINTRCREFGMEMLPSVANFVFLRLPASLDAKEIVQRLKEKNVHIKGPFKGVPVDGLIRVTLGPAKQMREFMDILKEVLEEVQVGTK